MINKETKEKKMKTQTDINTELEAKIDMTKYDSSMSYEDMLGVAQENGWDNDVKIIEQAIEDWHNCEK